MEALLCVCTFADLGSFSSASRRKQRHAVMLSLPPPSLAVLRHIHSILASQIESFSPGMIFFPLAPAFPTQVRAKHPSRTLPGADDTL